MQNAWQTIKNVVASFLSYTSHSLYSVATLGQKISLEKHTNNNIKPTDDKNEANPIVLIFVYDD